MIANKEFEFNNINYSISIDGSVEMPLFNAIEIGYVIEIANVRSSIQHFDNDFAVSMQVDTVGGKQTSKFLTELGLYHLLSASRKPIAIPFSKWIFNTLREIREEQLQNLIENIKTESELSRHNALIKSYNKKRIIYLTKVKDIDGKMVIKIGQSDDIKTRTTSLATKFGKSVIRDIFECLGNREFEKFLHRHPKIAPFSYKETIYNDAKSTETFLIDENEYNNILKVIIKNIKDYQCLDVDQKIKIEELNTKYKELDVESQKIKAEKEKASILSNIEKNMNENVILDNIESKSPQKSFIGKIIMDFVDKQVEEKIEVAKNNIINSQPPTETIVKEIIIENQKKHSSTKGPVVQKYDPTTFDLIETYENFIESVRKNPNTSGSAIRSAAKNNTLYKNFRWHLIDRSADRIKHDIKPTVKSQISRKGLIAMLDLKKQNILKVYGSQKEASIDRNFKNGAAISKAIKLGTQSSGHYWMHYEDCSQELKDTYTHELPNKQEKKGTRINQLHPNTKKVINTYDTISDIIRDYKISRDCLKNACKNNEKHCGYYWQYA